MPQFLESALRYVFLLFNQPADVWQVMHDQSTILTVFMVMMMAIFISYGLLYHVIDHPSMNKRKHLWAFILSTSLATSGFALLYVPHSVNKGFQEIQRQQQESAMSQESESAETNEDGLEGSEESAESNAKAIAPVNDGLAQALQAGTLSFVILDAVPVAIATFFWTVVFYILLTLSPVPRRYSTNCRTLKIF
jgi:hypothetical protein